MEEGKTMENLDAQMGWLRAMIEDETALPSEKMHHLLLALGKIRAKAEQIAAPFFAVIEAESLKMGEAIGFLVLNEATIKAALEECLDAEFEHDKWKYEGEAGTAQMVKPKPRISYDTKALEALRESSDANERLLSRFRKVKPSTPYLKIKLK